MALCRLKLGSTLCDRFRSVLKVSLTFVNELHSEAEILLFLNKIFRIHEWTNIYVFGAVMYHITQPAIFTLHLIEQIIVFDSNYI